MSLESDIAKTFQDNGWTWKLAGKGEVVPSEEEIEAALDEAARLLYDEPVDTQLLVGRLIIRKKIIGHDVYIFAGPYQ